MNIRKLSLQGGSVASLVILGWLLWTSFARSDDIAAGRDAIDSETKEIFKITMGRDFKGFPAINPKTGKNTLYPVERCYWNQCGKIKGGTPVILNDYLGILGPTKCPTCGKKVVGHNPLPPNTRVDDQGILHENPIPPEEANTPTDGSQ